MSWVQDSHHSAPQSYMYLAPDQSPPQDAGIRSPQYATDHLSRGLSDNAGATQSNATTTLVPEPSFHRTFHSHSTDKRSNRHRRHPPQPSEGQSNLLQSIKHNPNSAPMVPPAEVQMYGPIVRARDNQHHQSFFQWSQCTGVKKALCIGINYTGSSNPLEGCVNDARNMRQFLIRQYNYKHKDIVVLTDDTNDPRRLPTRDNMINAMRWLVQGAHAHDSLFFHWHGGQTPDKDGDEENGLDEVIFPLDYKTKGHIVDDDLFKIMVRPLPPGCRLTAIFDSCHSGSVLDLQYVYNHRGKVKEPDVGMLLRDILNPGELARERRARASRTSPSDTISFSGSKDDQTSADTRQGGHAVGAMSYAFIQSLSRNPQQSYSDVLNSVRAILRKHYSQIPQLSSSHPMDMRYLFKV